MDVKCPGSGEAAKMDWANLRRLTRDDQVKFVIKDRADYEFARDVVTRERLADRVGGGAVLAGARRAGRAASSPTWILADRLPVRLQLQAHKYIWRQTTRGVVMRASGRARSSGGLDSYTAAAVARRDGFELYALSIHYGQRHARELEAARAVARALGVARHVEIDLDLSRFGGSALTDDIAVPEGSAARCRRTSR